MTDKAVEAHRAAIMAASERSAIADSRVSSLGYANIPQDPDARIKQRQAYDLARADAYAARRELEQLIRAAPVSAAKTNEDMK